VGAEDQKGGVLEIKENLVAENANSGFKASPRGEQKHQKGAGNPTRKDRGKNTLVPIGDMRRIFLHYNNPAHPFDRGVRKKKKGVDSFIGVEPQGNKYCDDCGEQGNL